MMPPNYMQMRGLVAGARRRRRAVAARRRRRGARAVAPGSRRRSTTLVTAGTQAHPICNPNNPTGARLTHAELDGSAVSRPGRRLDRVRRDLSRRRDRRRRDADGVGPIRARDRHERPVEGVRPARPADWMGRAPAGCRRRAAGAFTTTRRSRPARSTTASRASRSHRPAATGCSRARAAIISANYPVVRDGSRTRAGTRHTSRRKRARSCSSAIATPSTRRARRAAARRAGRPDRCPAITSRWTATCGSASERIPRT